MKLAKKVLACVVALVLISTLAISAFAADAKLDVKAPANAYIGKEVTVTVAVSGAKGLESGTVTLGFDPAVLEFSAAKATAEFKDLVSMCEVGKASDKSVNCSFALSGASEADAISMFTVTFKVKAAGDTTVTVEALDGDFAPMKAVSGSATIKCSEEPVVTTAEPTTKAPVVTKPDNKIPATGDAGIAVVAGLVVLAGAAFVASKKTK